MIFQGYKVYYTTNPNLALSQWESQFVDNNKLTTVSDLVPHTIYTIRVEAYTAIGPGPPSPPVQVGGLIKYFYCNFRVFLCQRVTRGLYAPQKTQKSHKIKACILLKYFNRMAVRWLSILYCLLFFHSQGHHRKFSIKNRASIIFLAFSYKFCLFCNR